MSVAEAADDTDPFELADDFDIVVDTEGNIGLSFVEAGDLPIAEVGLTPEMAMQLYETLGVILFEDVDEEDEDEAEADGDDDDDDDDDPGAEEDAGGES